MFICHPALPWKLPWQMDSEEECGGFRRTWSRQWVPLGEQLHVEYQEWVDSSPPSSIGTNVPEVLIKPAFFSALLNISGGC